MTFHIHNLEEQILVLGTWAHHDIKSPSNGVISTTASTYWLEIELRRQLNDARISRGAFPSEIRGINVRSYAGNSELGMVK